MSERESGYAQAWCSPKQRSQTKWRRHCVGHVSKTGLSATEICRTRRRQSMKESINQFVSICQSTRSSNDPSQATMQTSNHIISMTTLLRFNFCILNAPVPLPFFLARFFLVSRRFVSTRVASLSRWGWVGFRGSGLGT